MTWLKRESDREKYLRLTREYERVQYENIRRPCLDKHARMVELQEKRRELSAKIKEEHR